MSVFEVVTTPSSVEDNITTTASEYVETSTEDEQLFVAEEGNKVSVEEGSGNAEEEAIASNVSEEVTGESTTTLTSPTVDVENTGEDVGEEEDDFEVSIQVSDGEKPNQDVWIPVELGPDGSPQIAPGFEGIAPPVNGMYNCTELGEGLFNCTIVTGPCKGDNLVTSDAMEIKNHIENLESNLCQSAGASGDIKPGVIFPNPVIANIPEAPVAPATTSVKPPAPSDAEVIDVDVASEVIDVDAGSEVIDTGDEDPEEPPPTFHTLTPDNLETASYQDICGTTPWTNKTYRDQHASPR